MSSTLTGTIVLPNDTVYVGDIRFVRRSPAAAIGTEVVTGMVFDVTTDAQGAFTTPLRMGVYDLHIPGSRPLSVNIQEDDKTYVLTDVIGAGIAQPPAPYIYTAP